MSWPLSISYLNGSIHLECIDTSTSVSMLDVCIPVFFLQFFILYNLERRKKKRFSCPATTNEWKRNDARGRRGLCRQMTQDFRRCLCVCVFAGICSGYVYERVYTTVCLCSMCIYTYLYTRGERTELRKEKAGHRTEKNNNSSSSSKRSDYLSNTKK